MGFSRARVVRVSLSEAFGAICLTRAEGLRTVQWIYNTGITANIAG